MIIILSKYFQWFKLKPKIEFYVFSFNSHFRRVLARNKFAFLSFPDFQWNTNFEFFGNSLTTSSRLNNTEPKIEFSILTIAAKMSSCILSRFWEANTIYILSSDLSRWKYGKMLCVFPDFSSNCVIKVYDSTSNIERIIIFRFEWKLFSKIKNKIDHWSLLYAEVPHNITNRSITIYLLLKHRVH